MTRREPLVSGLVAGTRKAGTTWLYENFRRDNSIRVSEQVKESGYFAGTGPKTAEAYEHLFDRAGKGAAVEIDTSVCYADGACQRIMEYNPDMRVVLVFRDPVEFLESRHRHGLRKGELREGDPLDAFRANDWLRSELDYPAVVAQFTPLAERAQLAILDYDELRSDPIGFYALAKRSLGLNGDDEYEPFSEPVNVARVSRFPMASRLLSDGAKAARKLGAHGLVNRLKATGLHSRFERKVPAERPQSRTDLTAGLQELCPQTIEFYRKLVEERM